MSTNFPKGMNRRSFLKGAAAAGAAAAGVGAISGCSSERGPNDVVLWGAGGDGRAYQQQIIEAFNKENPEINIIVSNVPGSGDGDATSVITAVRGGTAPDLWYMDRFSCAQYASLGLLESISPLLEKYEDPTFLDQFLPFAVNELRLNGQVYGLPNSTDTRVLFYNKKILRDAGIDTDALDPANGAPTVATIDAMSDKLIKKDDRGNYTRLGLIPYDAQGWGYGWALGNRASFFDNATCGIDLTAKPILDAYDYLYQWAREKDYTRVDAFKATYEPPNHTPAQTSFLQGNQGFQINTNSFAVGSVKKYKPDLELGFTHLPVFNEGDPTYTWSGGFSLVAPKGSSLSEPMWKFMKFYCGKVGQKTYITQSGGLPTKIELLSDPAFASQKFYIEQLKSSTSRPPFPVSQIWWEAMASAQQSIQVGSKNATEALAAAQARVGPQMDLYCPFTMPDGYGKTGY